MDNLVYYVRSLRLALLAAFSCICCQCTAIDQMTQWWEVPPTSTVHQVGIAAGLGNCDCSSKQYALFMIDVNSTTNGVFTGFELKASTNNFSSAASEDVKLQFYSQSEIADTGRDGDEFNHLGIDKMKLFACTSFGSDDVRSYAYITNTVVFLGQPMRIAALVDASCLKRHPDGDWLSDSNEDLVWCYARNTLNSGMEKEKRTSKALWRACAPVRWYKELPSWAKTGQ